MGIIKHTVFTTAGTSTSRSQVFFNNYLTNIDEVQTTFFSFNKPMYYTYGGTLDYYSQDPYAIFTNLVRPPIRFQFTANTASLSGDSYFVHDIYRLDYATHRLYSDNQIDNTQVIINTANSTKDSINGAPPATNAPNRQSSGMLNSKVGNNSIPQPEKFFGEPLTNNDLKTIQTYFTTPLITITASTSAITGTIYDLFLDQYVKQMGNYKTELFLDKSQYFIDTRIMFNVDLNKNYSDFLNNTIGTRTSQGLSSWSDTLQISASNNSRQIIQSGPYAGIGVVGNFFTFFVVPDKPVLEYPIMSGVLTTFTPEFRWSNGDKADSFLVQINYNTGDTGFTGTVYNYPVEKSAQNAQSSRNTVITSLTEQLSTDKNIYTFQLPMKSNSSFLYRVGNSKELIDVFNVRRNVITFSEYYTATSQPQPIKVYVQAESDSPHMIDIGGLLTPPSLDYESVVGMFTLSGTVSGSTVTGATMQLTLPTSAFITTTTDLLGNYSFSGLEIGNYTLMTNYRGYQQDSRAINLTGNTSLNLKIHLLWSDSYDTWGKMASENYYL